MKKLVLLTLILVGGHYAYQYLNEEPPAPAPAPEPVNFFIRVSVGKLFEEWQRRTLSNPPGTGGVQTVDPSSELKEIQRRLHQEGNYSADAVRDVVVRALRELRVSEENINQVTAGIMSMR
ncbi:MAG: hypothetical protein ACO3J2_09975 [Chthoniobacterales bacterium]